MAFVARASRSFRFCSASAAALSGGGARAWGLTDRNTCPDAVVGGGGATATLGSTAAPSGAWLLLPPSPLASTPPLSSSLQATGMRGQQAAWQRAHRIDVLDAASLHRLLVRHHRRPRLQKGTPRMASVRVPEACSVQPAQPTTWSPRHAHSFCTRPSRLHERRSPAHRRRPWVPAAASSQACACTAARTSGSAGGRRP